MTPDPERREFLKGAVAAGGVAAPSACLGYVGDETVPAGTDDPESLPERQHAWNDRSRTDEAGNVELPSHQVLLYLTYRGDVPTDDDRAAVEAALGTLDRAYERSHEGLLHSVAYSPAYFDRFEASLPGSVDLPTPRKLTSIEDPELDTQDALVHLASDRPDVVLEAEAALRSERKEANGVPVEASLEGILEVAHEDDRRTGFIAPGMPAERQDGLAEAGHLVVRADDGDGPGEVVGHATLPAGHHTDVAVGVDPAFLEERDDRVILHAQVYADDGDGEFDPEADRPVTAGSEPVASRVTAEKTNGFDPDDDGPDINTPADGSGTDAPSTDGSSAPSEQPGFGAAIAVLGLVAAALFARYRGGP